MRITKFLQGKMLENHVVSFLSDFIIILGEEKLAHRKRT